MGTGAYRLQQLAAEIDHFKPVSVSVEYKSRTNRKLEIQFVFGVIQVPSFWKNDLNFQLLDSFDAFTSTASMALGGRIWFRFINVSIVPASLETFHSNGICC